MAILDESKRAFLNRGANMLAYDVKESLSALSFLARGTHIGEVSNDECDRLSQMLPPQFLTRYDYEFLFKLFCETTQMADRLEMNLPIEPKHPCEELILYMSALEIANDTESCRRNYDKDDEYDDEYDDGEDGESGEEEHDKDEEYGEEINEDMFLRDEIFKTEEDYDDEDDIRVLYPWLFEMIDGDYIITNLYGNDWISESEDYFITNWFKKFKYLS